MNCEKYFGLIDDLVEEELDEQTAGKLELHIFSCPDCKAHYENLQQEKRIYANCFSEIERPVALPEKFRRKLGALPDNVSYLQKISGKFFGWTDKLNLAQFPDSNRAGAALSLILIALGIGFILWKIVPNEAPLSKNNHLIENSSIDTRTLDRSPASISTEETSVSSEPAISSRLNLPKKTENPSRTRFLSERTPRRENAGINVSHPIERTKLINTVNTKNLLAVNSPLSPGEKARRIQLSLLEQETAGQVEKIELLLRSVRNARATDNGGIFDLSYEKQQARKLLEKNAQLRQAAENYDSLYAEEILAQLEPYLLDIANLDVHPSPVEVSSIKERVKNQNLIARLQAYY